MDKEDKDWTEIKKAFDEEDKRKIEENNEINNHQQSILQSQGYDSEGAQSPIDSEQTNMNKKVKKNNGEPGINNNSQGFRTNSQTMEDSQVSNNSEEANRNSKSDFMDLPTAE